MHTLFHALMLSGGNENPYVGNPVWTGKTVVESSGTSISFKLSTKMEIFIDGRVRTSWTETLYVEGAPPETSRSKVDWSQWWPEVIQDLGDAFECKIECAEAVGISPSPLNIPWNTWTQMEDTIILDIVNNQSPSGTAWDTKWYTINLSIRNIAVPANLLETTLFWTITVQGPGL